MKEYLAEKTFKTNHFPLMVALAPQMPSMPLHYHDFIELVFVGHGHSIHSFFTDPSGEISYGLIQGDVFSVMPGEVHKYSKSKNLILYNIAFQKEIIRNEIDELVKLNSWSLLFNANPGIIRKKIHLALPDLRAAEKCLKIIIMEFSLEKSGFELNAKIAFLEFLVIAARATETEWKASPNTTHTGILESINLMEEFPENPFHLKSFAEIAAMSVSSYTTKFREATGLSPLDYFIGIRMEKVRWLLSETSLSISEIAYKCGFCDTNYLIKLFRVRQGITPGKYRNLIRSHIHFRY